MSSVLRTLVTQRSTLFLLAGVLLVAGCSTSKPESTPSPPSAATFTPLPTDTPLPTETPLPTPTPSPIPPPTPTLGPTPTPLPKVVLRPSVAGQVAYAGTLLAFEVASLKPLERADVFFTSPEGDVSQWRGRAVRADSQGRARWSRDSITDVTGLWGVTLQGELGSLIRLSYTLRDAELPTQVVIMGETTFQVYRTPEGAFHFENPVRPAAVLRVAEVYLQARSRGSQSLDYIFQDTVDFFLAPSAEALNRELRVTGVEGGEGLEGGISIFGSSRPGIYVNMGNPVQSIPHIVAHEVSHQVLARIGEGRTTPHWLGEGLAEYLAFTVASGVEPGQELSWRRLMRDRARRAVNEGLWVDLGTLADQEVWFNETDIDKVLLFYGQAYTTLDYVARTYGEQTLRPLVENLADRPEEVDAVFQELFALSFAEFQDRVRASVLQRDEHEQGIEAIIQYAGAMFAVLDYEEPVNVRWRQFVGDRQGLTRQQRIDTLVEIAGQYQALLARVEGARAPEPAQEAQEVFLRAFSGYGHAMESFLAFEREGDAEAVDRGNEALESANFLRRAARDRLISLLNQSGIQQEETEAGRAG